MIMETNVIKIKCPCCAAVLAVKAQPGIENKNVTCPVCKQSSSFQLFKKIAEKKSDSTEYPGEHTDYESCHTETQINSDVNYTLGKLKVQGLGFSFRLKVGRNVIGRKATASTADIQIPITEGKHMSREHLVIEVKKVAGKGIVHYASLYKEKVNPTAINNILLEYGDSIVLKSGDKLKLPDATIIFEIPDDEGTEI